MDDIKIYTFGSEKAKHMFCGACGVQPFSIPRSDPDLFHINVLCLEPGTIRRIRVHNFDGAHWEASFRRALEDKAGGKDGHTEVQRGAVGSDEASEKRPSVGNSSGKRADPHFVKAADDSGTERSPAPAARAGRVTARGGNPARIRRQARGSELSSDTDTTDSEASGPVTTRVVRNPRSSRRGGRRSNRRVSAGKKKGGSATESVGKAGRFDSHPLALTGVLHDRSPPRGSGTTPGSNGNETGLSYLHTLLSVAPADGHGGAAGGSAAAAADARSGASTMRSTVGVPDVQMTMVPPGNGGALTQNFEFSRSPQRATTLLAGGHAASRHHPAVRDAIERERGSGTEWAISIGSNRPGGVPSPWTERSRGSRTQMADAWRRSSGVSSSTPAAATSRPTWHHRGAMQGPGADSSGHKSYAAPVPGAGGFGAELPTGGVRSSIHVPSPIDRQHSPDLSSLFLGGRGSGAALGGAGGPGDSGGAAGEGSRNVTRRSARRLHMDGPAEGFVPARQSPPADSSTALASAAASASAAERLLSARESDSEDTDVESGHGGDVGARMGDQGLDGGDTSLESMRSPEASFSSASASPGSAHGGAAVVHASQESVTPPGRSSARGVDEDAADALSPPAVPTPDSMPGASATSRALLGRAARLNGFSTYGGGGAKGLGAGGSASFGRDASSFAEGNPGVPSKVGRAGASGAAAVSPDGVSKVDRERQLRQFLAHHMPSTTRGPR